MRDKSKYEIPFHRHTMPGGSQPIDVVAIAVDILDALDAILLAVQELKASHDPLVTLPPTKLWGNE